MANPASNVVMALGSVAAVALCAPAFVPSTAPVTGASPAVRGSAAQAPGATPSAGAAGAATVAASVGIAALAATRIGAKRSSRAAGVVRCAEAPFAGGLVGSESAFGGTYEFDPMGLSVKCEKFLPWFRESELKHGRICMMAWVGLVVPEIVRIPGDGACYTASVVDAHNACIGDGKWQNGPLQQVFLFCAVVEMLTTFPKCVQGLTLENAGDYQLGTSFLPQGEDKIKEMKLKELKNGRLAMMAFGGAVTQAVLTGNGFPWLYAEGSSRKGPGLASSIGSARNCAVRGSSRIAMKAEGGYKMSKAVPFLPMSPALEGYVGEEDGFDPLGVSLAIDIAWLRESELKHGRVAMLATVGWIATDMGMRVPGEPFEVSTIEAHDAMVKFGAMPQMLVWLGLLEVFGFLAFNNAAEGRTDRAPGDFGLRMLYPTDAAGQYSMQLKELRNGRLAMLAFGGIATAAVLTGKTWPFLATADKREAPAFGAGSALCGGLQAPKTQRGSGVAAQAMERSYGLPFLPKPANLGGYVGGEAEFDPLGFSDTFDMKWLRESELKHGRVCMLACVGFYSQQYITFPGFTPTENALDSVYTAAPGGMAALLFLSGYIESASYGGKLTMLDMFEGDREPGYHFQFGAGFLKGKSDKDVEVMKVKELTNGRLAMLAFSGMVHHNLVVKGPLFPLFPDGWTGPQGSWELDSVFGRLNTVGAASTWGV